MRRRRVLASVSLALTGFSGCLEFSDGSEKTPRSGSTQTENNSEFPDQTTRETATTGSGINPNELGGYIRPDGEPQTVPVALDCEQPDFTRREGWTDDSDLIWGTLTDVEGNPIFALRVNKQTVERGEEVTFTFTNVSPVAQKTANFYRTTFEVYTEAGWQDPRGYTGVSKSPVPDNIEHWKPGEQFEYTLQMTADGVVEEAYNELPTFRTCPELPPGRYRFGTAASDLGDVFVAFEFVENPAYTQTPTLDPAGIIRAQKADPPPDGAKILESEQISYSEYIEVSRALSHAQINEVTAEITIHGTKRFNEIRSVFPEDAYFEGSEPGFYVKFGLDVYRVEFEKSE